MLTLKEMFDSQKMSVYRQNLQKLEQGKDSCFTIDENKLVSSKPIFRWFTTSFCVRSSAPSGTLHCYHPINAGYPDAPQMYDNLRRHICGPYMASGVYSHEERRKSCGSHRHSKKHQRQIELLSPDETLEFVAINILGPLTKTE